MAVDTKTRTERGGEQTGTGGSTDEGKGVEVYLYRARGRSFIYHDIYPIVLHGGIEILLHHRAQTVDLIDEEHVVGFQRSKQAREVTGFVEDGSGGDFEAYPELVGDDIGEGGFSQSRRAEEEHMVERLMAKFGCLYEDL